MPPLAPHLSCWCTGIGLFSAWTRAFLSYNIDRLKSQGSMASMIPVAATPTSAAAASTPRRKRKFRFPHRHEYIHRSESISRSESILSLHPTVHPSSPTTLIRKTRNLQDDGSLSISLSMSLSLSMSMPQLGHETPYPSTSFPTSPPPVPLVPAISFALNEESSNIEPPAADVDANRGYIIGLITVTSLLLASTSAVLVYYGKRAARRMKNDTMRRSSSYQSSENSRPTTSLENTQSNVVLEEESKAESEEFHDAQGEESDGSDTQYSAFEKFLNGIEDSDESIEDSDEISDVPEGMGVI